jgi:hypothetical protein
MGEVRGQLRSLSSLPALVTGEVIKARDALDVG